VWAHPHRAGPVRGRGAVWWSARLRGRWTEPWLALLPPFSIGLNLGCGLACPKLIERLLIFQAYADER
jgi:hypothetical protein